MRNLRRRSGQVHLTALASHQEQRFVRIQENRIATLDALHNALAGPGRHEESAIGCIRMLPELFTSGYQGNGLKIIHRAREECAGARHDEKRFCARSAIFPNEFGQCAEVYAPIGVRAPGGTTRQVSRTPAQPFALRSKPGVNKM